MFKVWLEQERVTISVGLNLELVKAFARQTLLNRFLEVDLEFGNSK